MNVNLLTVLFVAVLLGGAVGVNLSPATATETPQGSTTDEDLGDDVSAFMQHGVAAANGSVDSGMWHEAFETAENHTRKKTLVNRRAAVLSARLDRLETRIERFSPRPTNRSVPPRIRRVRLVADRNALRTSVAEAKTTAASEGVNATHLDKLDRRLANLSVDPVSNSARSTVRDGTNAAPATGGDTTDAAPADRSTGGMTYGGP